MGREIDSNEGGLVVLTAGTWAHIVAEHPEMGRFLDAVVRTAIAPDVAADDPRPGRRRHFAEGLGPSRWLRVVVDFNDEPPRIVTAHGYRKEHPK